jgi:hypothetical protein
MRAMMATARRRPREIKRGLEERDHTAERRPIGWIGSSKPSPRSAVMISSWVTLGAQLIQLPPSML